MNGGGLFVCLLLLLLTEPPPSNAQNPVTCDASDHAALQAFLGGLKTHIQGWNLNSSSPNCCSWQGVFCDAAGRVFKLDLANRSLEGSISESLAALDKLNYLSLSSNLLTGPVPSNIFGLKLLQSLNLSANELSGSFPQELSLPSLKFFNISYNRFNGSHPILSGSADLEEFDVSFNMFSGGINTTICNLSAGLKTLKFSMNSFSGDFPRGFSNCRSLQELCLDCNELTGNLAEDLFELRNLSQLYVQQNDLFGNLSVRISNLCNLSELDISVNRFLGEIPDVFYKFEKLKLFLAHSNGFQGSLPPSVRNVSSLKMLNLRNNSLSGKVNLNFTALAQLTSLDLGSNFFTGLIPDSISQCVNLKTLNLARNNLSGEIPSSFKNLTSLSYLSLSNNSFSNISLALGVLQDCPKLTSLVLTRSFRGGDLANIENIQGFKSIELLVIANCDLKGMIPQWLSKLKKLMVLDLSWNRLEGTIPSWIGDFDSLFYLDLSNNSFTGEIPGSMAKLRGLLSRNVSRQDISGQYFPFFIRRNTSSRGLQYNQLGSFPPSIILSNNKLVGLILPGFGNLKGLHDLDLSKNMLSGTIPEELSGMTSVETLDLSHNNLSGSIPTSLASLSFLSNFNVANNNLVGLVPTGGQFSTFQPSDFEGNPGLCGIHLQSCSPDTPLKVTPKKKADKGVIFGIAAGVGLGTISLLAIVYLVVSKSHSRRLESDVKEMADSHRIADSASSTLVLLFQNKDYKELSISDILKSTNNFDQANIIGCGGFGLVYKGSLPDGKNIAIKRLSGDYCQMEREFQAEVQALSRAQHQNLVMLEGYCRIGNDRLLIYSYMENGSLDYWLHEKLDGGSTLNWETRLRIAQGAARGLAYLHQSCQPHILHRDIKTSNILLDQNFVAHLADFGLARLILPYDTHVTTDLVGTLGYIPPEYGQASVATFKGDVYSFGVVLLELLTGKRPVDMCKQKAGRDLISWVLQMKKEKRESEIFDPYIYDKEHDRQLMQVLEIACLCLSESPKLRPLTHQLVTWLDSIGLDIQLIK